MSGLLMIAIVAYNIGFGFLLLTTIKSRWEIQTDQPTLQWDHREIFLLAEEPDLKK